ERGENAQVVVHVGDGALDVVLHGFDGGSGGREPELLIGIEAKILGDFEDAGEVGGEAFGVPAIDGQIPPHGPLPTRQAVDGLKVHEGAKAFNMVHGGSVGALATMVHEICGTGLRTIAIAAGRWRRSIAVNASTGSVCGSGDPHCSRSGDRRYIAPGGSQEAIKSASPKRYTLDLLWKRQ